MINNRQAGRRRGRNGSGTGPRPQQGGRGPEGGNRIDNRARGNASQLHEKYKTLARDAQMQGDRVNTEYYLQFADHYFRVLSETRVRAEESRKSRDDGGATEIDDEDDFDGDVIDDGIEPRRDTQRNDGNRNENREGNRDGNRQDQREPRGERRPRDENRQDTRGRDDGQRQDGNRDNGNRDRDRDNGRQREERGEGRFENRGDNRQREERGENGRGENNRNEPRREGENRPPRAERPMREERTEAEGEMVIDSALMIVEPAEAPVEAPKRRGRPRKILESNAEPRSNDAANDGAPESFDTTVLPPSIGAAEAGGPDDEPRPRRRGRPRRVEVDEVEAN